MRLAAKFPLGRVAATPGALEAMAASGQTPDFFLAKHLAGDWGEVGAEDWRANDEALLHGDRLLSDYKTRVSTVVLLPEEY